MRVAPIGGADRQIWRSRADPVNLPVGLTPAGFNTLSALQGEREGRGAKRWEAEVGSASALESPTSPQPSPPPGAEREQIGRRVNSGGNAGHAADHRPF